MMLQPLLLLLRLFLAGALMLSPRQRHFLLATLHITIMPLRSTILRDHDHALDVALLGLILMLRLVW
jgi:hypothetical protein